MEPNYEGSRCAVLFFSSIGAGLRCVATLLLDANEVAAIEATIRHHVRVHACQSVAQLLGAIDSMAPTMIVSDLRDAHGGDVLRAVSARGDGSSLRAMLLLSELTPFAHRQILSASSVGLTPKLVVRHSDDVAATVAREARATVPLDARTAVLQAVAAIPTLANREVVLATVALGARRRAVAEVARFCCVSERTLERRVELAGLPSVRRLLALSLVLNAAWRLEILGLPIRRAATACGFNSSSAFVNYLNRQIGAGPLGVQRVGFSGMLELYVSELTSVAPATSLIDLRPSARCHVD